MHAAGDKADGGEPKKAAGARSAAGLPMVAVGAVAAFAGIAGAVVGGETRAFDVAALSWIGADLPDRLEGPMRAVTALGYYAVVVPLMVVAAGAFYLKGSGLSAALLVASTGGGIALTTALKAAFVRDRPEVFDSGYEATSHAFPSGHAAVAVAFYGVLAVLVASRLRGIRRWAVAVAGTLLVLLLGFSRLYLGVHYPTDVAAGYLLAVLWSGAVGGALLAYRGRTIRSSPAPPEGPTG